MVVFEIEKLFKELETEWLILSNSGIDQYFQQKNEGYHMTTSEESVKAILRMYLHQTPFEFFTQKLNHTDHLSRYCIAVGVVSDSDTIVDIMVHSCIISTLHLEKDVPELILTSETILPLVSLIFVEQQIIKHNRHAGIKVIYAHLNHKYRNDFSRNAWTIKKEENEYFYIHDGILWTEPSMEHEYHILPCVTVSWKRLMDKKKEMTNIIEHELIEKTWHPSRFVDWCLSVDEK